MVIHKWGDMVAFVREHRERFECLLGDGPKAEAGRELLQAAAIVFDFAGQPDAVVLGKLVTCYVEEFLPAKRRRELFRTGKYLGK